VANRERLSSTSFHGAEEGMFIPSPLLAMIKRYIEKKG
jgi:hypothetical protein